MRLIFLVVILLQFSVAYSQNVDFNKVILPENVTPYSFEEKLVQLAWKNHPTNKIVLKNVEIAHKERNLARLKWLDDIYATGNLNEYTINPAPDAPTNMFFPRYNFGIRISVGTFVSTPIRSRIESDNIVNSENEVNERKLVVREQVLSGLEKLKQYYKFMKLREQIKEDFLTMYKDAEKKFSLGEVDIEKYRSSVQAYYNQAEEVVEAQTNYNGAKIVLEALVGVPLLEIDGYQQFLQKLDAEIKID